MEANGWPSSFGLFPLSLISQYIGRCPCVRDLKLDLESELEYRSEKMSLKISHLQKAMLYTEEETDTSSGKSR